MAPKKRFFVIALVLMALLTAGALYMADSLIHENKDRAPNNPSNPSTNNDVTGQNVTFTITKGSEKQWEIKAEHTQFYEDRSGADLQGVSGTFYNASGKPVLQFTAPTGRYLEADKAVFLTGGVVAKTTEEKPSELRAPQMKWSSRSNEVLADGNVSLVYGGFSKSTASRCRFTLSFDSVILEGDTISEVAL